MTEENQNEDWEIIDLDDETPGKPAKDEEDFGDNEDPSKTSGKSSQADEDDVDFEIEEEEDPSGSPPDEDESDEDGSPQKKGSRAERRIKRLLNRAKSAEEKMAEYQKKIEELQNNYQKVSGDYRKTEDFALKSAEDNIASQEESLKAQWQAAADEGDYEKMWKINQTQAKLASDKSLLEQYKSRQPKQEEQADKQGKDQDQAPPQDQPNIHPKTWQWYNKNKQWYGQDYEMTITAREINDQLIYQEGVDPTTDEFYNELDTRLRREFPDKFKSQGRKPAVTGARGPSSPKTSNKVKLTAGEKAFCDREGIPYKEFAKQKRALNDE